MYTLADALKMMFLKLLIRLQPLACKLRHTTDILSVNNKKISPVGVIAGAEFLKYFNFQ